MILNSKKPYSGRVLTLNALLLSFSLLLFSSSFTQVNGYAEVTGITGMLSLSVTNENEAFDAFVAGEQIVIMQMQDDVIGNSSNSANFGDLGSINSAGLYFFKCQSGGHSFNYKMLKK